MIGATLKRRRSLPSALVGLETPRADNCHMRSTRISIPRGNAYWWCSFRRQGYKYQQTGCIVSWFRTSKL